MRKTIKMADKKKADYQEILQKDRADSAEGSCDSYMKDPEKSRARSRESYMKDPEKGRADSAARSRKSYMKDPEKTLQHKAAKLTRKTWRRVAIMKLAWLYPTKVRKQLQS